MRMKDIINEKGKDVITINMEATIYEAIKLLNKHRIGALVVLNNNGKLAGIISERDILKECEDRSELLSKTTIKEVMTKDIIIGQMDDELEYIMGIMTKKRIRHLPIIKYDKIVGIISMRDLVKAQLQKSEFEIHDLKEYIYERY